MQRQSLGSPSSSKHQYEENGVVRDAGTVTLLSSKATGDEDEHKPQKPLHKTTSSGRYIHLIPLLTMLCLLILYLSSHDPSEIDLAQFNGFKRLQNPLESTNIDNLEEILDIEKGNILAIRSLRNLQEIDKEGANHHRHRKIGDF